MCVGQQGDGPWGIGVQHPPRIPDQLEDQGMATHNDVEHTNIVVGGQGRQDGSQGGGVVLLRRASYAQVG